MSKISPSDASVKYSAVLKTDHPHHDTTAYAGYCFYTTAEKINKTRDKFGIGLPRSLASFELPSRKARKSAVTQSGDQ